MCCYVLTPPHRLSLWRRMISSRWTHPNSIRPATWQTWPSWMRPVSWTICANDTPTWGSMWVPGAGMRRKWALQIFCPSSDGREQLVYLPSNQCTLWLRWGHRDHVFDTIGLPLQAFNISVMGTISTGSWNIFCWNCHPKIFFPTPLLQTLL